MKVNELLEGTYDDERGEYYPDAREQAAIDAAEEEVKEYFNQNFISLAGVMGLGFDELANYAQQAGLKNEAKFLSQYIEADSDDYYVSRDIGKKLDELDTIIGNEEPQMVEAIKQVVAILSKNMTTEEDWMDSQDAQDVGSEAKADYEEGGMDPYAQRGLKRSDFY